MNPLKPTFTIHPTIKRDEFKPETDKKGMVHPKILRRFLNDISRDFPLLVEDGPKETFRLKQFSARIAAETSQQGRSHIQHQQLPLDQATVHKIVKPKSHALFEGADFLIFEDSPDSKQVWQASNPKKTQRPA